MGKGGADTLIYCLTVGSLYHPSEHMHVNKIVHKKQAERFVKINHRSPLTWQLIELTVLSPKLRSC